MQSRAIKWLMTLLLGLVSPLRAEPPSPTVTQLIQKLDDADARVRWRAASSLGRLGVTAQAAVPALAG